MREQDMKSLIKTGNKSFIQSERMKVLIDTNLILDVLLDRQCRTIDDTDHILGLVERREIDGYVTRRGLADILLVVQEIQGKAASDSIRQELEEWFSICEVDKDLIAEATLLHVPNFDNTIQMACFHNEQLDAIITLSPREFLGLISNEVEKLFPVFEPAEFLNLYYRLDSVFDDNFILDSSQKDCESKQEKLDLLTSQINQLDEELREPIFFEEYIDEKIKIGTEWFLDYYALRTAQDNWTEALVTLRRSGTGEYRTKSVQALGIVESACKAVDALVSEIYPEFSRYQKPIFYEFTAENAQGVGAAAPVQAKVNVRLGNEFYTGRYIHRNLHKAVFFAYIKAVDYVLHLKRRDYYEIIEQISHQPFQRMPKRASLELKQNAIEESQGILRELTPLMQKLMYRSGQQVSREEMDLINLFIQCPEATFAEAGKQLRCSEQEAEKKFDELKKKIRNAIPITWTVKPIDVDRENLRAVMRFCEENLNTAHSVCW
jgi:hypothetical protein